MKIVMTIYFLGLFFYSISFAGNEEAKHQKPNLKAEVVGHEEGEEHHDEHRDKHEKHAKEKHSDEKSHDKKDAKDSHDDHEEHGDHDEHTEKEEENPQVGEGKGITAASAEDGIKLSSQATKNFEIETIKITTLNNIIISQKAIVTAGDEVNIFRFRDGFYKRIDFDVVKKNDGKMNIKSKDLKVNDQIVIHGIGFLRIAEIAAFGGAPEGHSH